MRATASPGISSIVSITTKTTPSSTGIASRRRRAMKVSMAVARSPSPAWVEPTGARPWPLPPRERQASWPQRYLSSQTFPSHRLYSTGCTVNPLTLARVTTISLVLYTGIHTISLARMSCTSPRSEEHTSELQSRLHLVCRLLLEKKKLRVVGMDPYDEQ